MTTGGRYSPRVVIVGGGITGLAAAVWLRDHAPAARVTVVEASKQLGGKVSTREVAGVASEVGAESLLIRLPEARQLAERVGLGSELIYPTAARPSIWSGEELHALPARTVMGIPSTVDDLLASGLFRAQELAQVRGELLSSGTVVTDDIAVGALVTARLGRAVTNRLVSPLLGGVYATDSDDLSLEATIPALFHELQQEGSLVRAAAAAVAGSVGASSSLSPQPTFASVQGGLTRLVSAAATASEAEFLVGAPVRELTRTETGWRLVVGSTRDHRLLAADAVLLATPARPTARLLSTVAPAASAELATLEYASVALVNYVLADNAATAWAPAGLSGVLIPAESGLLTKAITLTSAKWPGYPADQVVLRASVGRYGDERALALDDASLIQHVSKEVGSIFGRPVPRPREAIVTRWGGALPQYRPGHVGLVRRVHEKLTEHPTLALAGAAYHGVGIARCIRSGQDAARRILEALTKPIVTEETEK